MMTKARSASIELRVADWSEIQNVLHGNFYEWASGLNKSKYNDWIWWQLCQPWARQNYRYLVAARGDEILSSCKLYGLEFQSRGQDFQVAGIGAVFTPERHRGSGYATQMIDVLVDRCRGDNFDGLLLFSDIDTEFYARSGFEELSNAEFHLWLADELNAGCCDLQSFELSPVHLDKLPQMIRHYQRYLRRQSFGIVREEFYWQYKLERERFLYLHSSNRWPVLELLTFDFGSPQGGYAVFEQGGKILRVLEVIGGPEAVDKLWSRLIGIGRERGIELIRGWESSAPPFLKSIKYSLREWGHPMLLPLNPGLENWLDAMPCPILELDHF